MASKIAQALPPFWPPRCSAQSAPYNCRRRREESLTSYFSSKARLVRVLALLVPTPGHAASQAQPPPPFLEYRVEPGFQFFREKALLHQLGPNRQGGAEARQNLPQHRFVDLVLWQEPDLVEALAHGCRRARRYTRERVAAGRRWSARRSQ